AANWFPKQSRQKTGGFRGPSELVQAFENDGFVMALATTWFNGATARTCPRLVLMATSLGVLLAQIDTSVVNLALKSIGADLHAGVSEMQWVIDSYNLVYAG